MIGPEIRSWSACADPNGALVTMTVLLPPLLVGVLLDHLRTLLRSCRDLGIEPPAEAVRALAVFESFPHASGKLVHIKGGAA